MTTSLLADTNAQLSNLTKQIRQAVDLLDRRARETDAITNLLRVNIVKWVDGQLAARNVANKLLAYEALADICKRKTTTISNWYLCGMVILENGLDPENIEATSVHYLRAHKEIATKSVWLKAVQMTKDRTPSHKVRQLLHTARYQTRAGSLTRLDKLSKEGLLTKNSLKMELLAIQTAARKLFKREDISVAIISGDFRTLLGVGEQAV